MEEEKLANLIRPLESLAEAKPESYRFRVGLLAALGYVYLLVIVSILLAIVAVTLFYVQFNWITLKILWIPLAVVGLVLRSLWITIPVPDGAELKREQAPRLFELIHEVSEKLSGPPVHHVLVSDEFNASIVQIPQFGMFGWLRNYVVVGLPLLRALNPTEFRAVLAHEVGHLSGKHGRFTGWIYRLRQSWVEVLTRVHYERHYASFLFEPFLKWYAPYLKAYSFVLARAQERQADKYAVELAGKEVAAVALVRLMTKERGVMENFWPNFFRQSKEQAKTPRDPFVQMLSGLDQPIGSSKTQKWLFEALRVQTGYEDTHPALGDRLAAIGFAKDGPEVTALIEELLKADEQQQSAASYYLEELPEDFLAGQNRLLRERIAHSWSESHEHIKQAQKRLAELDAQAQARALTIEEQWERVIILTQVEDRASTAPSIQAILSEHPDHAGAHFEMGAVLLEQQNAEGVKHLEKAMQLDPAMTGEASAMLSGFYFEQGNKELGEDFCKRAAEHFEKDRKQQEEALTFSAQDTFIPHGLDENAVKQIQLQLSKVRGLGRAYLVRKVIEGSDTPLYVLAATAAFTWREGQNAKHVDALFDELATITNLPSPIVIISLDYRHGYLQPKLARVEDAELFVAADNEAEVTYLT